MIRLIVHSGPQAGTELATAATTIRIGRHPDHNDLEITDTMTSARHCRLDRTPQGSYLLEDLGSSNGTFLGAEPIQKVLLRVGERFRIGSTEIEVSEGQPRLQVVRGPRAGIEVPLGNQDLSIGRAPDNHLVLGDPSVSSRHSRILCLPTGFVLEDTGSTNGTSVNGVPVARQKLVDGDVITVGDNDLRFLVDTPESIAASWALEEGAARQADARAQLVFVAGPHAGLKVPLLDQPVSLGRRSDCTVVLADMQVSGAHCRVSPEGLGFRLEDLGSSNGTRVNGGLISDPVELRPGDLLELGSSVVELELAGGTSASAQSTVVAEGSYVLAAQPRFVIDGQVLSRPSITIGRSPSCDVLLEGEAVSRVHCEIAWDGEGFVVEDRSQTGTYVGDRRVVREHLQAGHVLKIDEHVFSVTVRGDRLSLDTIDAEAALAALEVAREMQFDLRQAVLDPATSGALGQGYKTAFRVQQTDVEARVLERKAELKRKGAPMWKPTTDIQPQPVRPLAVAVAVGGALVVCAYLLLGSGSAALVNHPLSVAHQSRAFAASALGHGLKDGCQTCHSLGKGVGDEACTSCHPAFQGQVQARHLSPAAHGRGTAPGTCVGCHVEHRGAALATVLGATQSCKDAGCHPTAHANELFHAREEAPLFTAAPPLSSLDLSQEALHLEHAQVPGRCIACHGTKDGTEANARMSCFRCHGGGQALAVTQCRSCHVEHQGIHLARITEAASMSPATPPVAPGRSLAQGGMLVFVAFLPLVGVAVVHGLRSRRRAERLVATMQAIPSESFKRLVHSINKDKCVGCAMCVSACPASVLELVNHKSTVVNFDSCIQCRKCESACNFDALRMHEADKPPPMVDMPDVDSHYQTPVAGLYLIGQAAGTPQVKNASNLGLGVVTHLVGQGLRAGSAREAGVDAEVIIVGSGPAGLSTALSCVEHGLSYVLLEKGRDFAATVRNYFHKGKEVMAEPNDVKLVGRLPVWDSSREEILGKWKECIEEQQIVIHYDENAADVKKDGACFVVKTTGPKGNEVATYRGLYVVLAIGTMGNPRKLGCAGDDLPKVFNSLVDQDEYDNKSVLVVGGTDSAVEVALALASAHQGSNQVWLSVRGAKFDRIKPKNHQRIEEAIKAGKVKPLFSTAVAEVKETAVVVKHGDGRLEELPNDAIFAMIGGHPPVKWLQSIGVPYVPKPHSWSPSRTDYFGGTGS
jgi:pSer/pThr/pTyr-binding forkhead associated (FHA) protein/thioredoxin reductase/NAD-dependent dihydropyrimidine dehydrogenase PreA subunit